MSGLKKIFRPVGIPRIAELYPNLYERTMYKIASGSAYPRWWDAWRYCPPKENNKLGRISRIDVPLDFTIKEVLKRLPMLRKEELDYNDPHFNPLCARIASVWHRLESQEGMEKEAAFRKCEDDIFFEELYAFARNIRTSKGSYFGLTTAENKLFRLHDILNDMYGEVRPSSSAEAASLAASYFARRDAHIHKSPDPDYVFATEPIPQDSMNVTAKFYLRTRKYAPRINNPVPMADDLDNYKLTRRAGLPDHIPVSDWDHGVDMDARMALRFNIPGLETGRFKRGADPIDKNAFVTRMYRNMIKSSAMQNSIKDQKRHLPPDVPEGVTEFSIDSFSGKKFQPGIERIKDRVFNQSILGFMETSRQNKQKTEALKQNMREGIPFNMPRLDKTGFHMPNTAFDDNDVTLVNSKPVFKPRAVKDFQFDYSRTAKDTTQYAEELILQSAPVENQDAGHFPDYFKRAQQQRSNLKV